MPQWRKGHVITAVMQPTQHLCSVCVFLERTSRLLECVFPLLAKFPIGTFSFFLVYSVCTPCSSPYCRCIYVHQGWAKWPVEPRQIYIYIRDLMSLAKCSSYQNSSDGNTIWIQAVVAYFFPCIGCIIIKYLLYKQNLKFHIAVFWVVTTCSLVSGYECFGSRV
jgi:hypothetical protein